MHNRRRVGFIAGAGLLAGVGGLRSWIEHGGQAPGDRRGAIHYGQPPRFHQVTSLYTAAAGPTAALTTLPIAVWSLLRRATHREAAGMFFAAMVVPLTSVLKRKWGPTPLWAATMPPGGINYPSGHVAYATSVFGYIAFVGWQKQRNWLWVE